jgi:WD40 repeat protein
MLVAPLLLSAGALNIARLLQVVQQSFTTRQAVFLARRISLCKQTLTRVASSRRRKELMNMTRKITAVVALVLGLVALGLGNQPAPGKGPNTDLFGDPLPQGASARMGTARLWSPCVWLYNAAFHSEGKQLVSVGWDRKIRIWEVATGKELRQFPGAGFVVSADGTMLAYLGMDGPNLNGKYHVIELATGKTAGTITGGNPGISVFSPNNKTLAVAGFWDYESKIGLFRVATGKEFSQLDAKKGKVTALAFSPDQRTLAAANDDNTITLWDTPTDKINVDLIAHKSKVMALAFAADGATLVSAGEDQTARVWDVAKGNEMRQFPVGAGKRAFFSAGGRRLAVVDQSNALVFYDVSSGKELGRWRGNAPSHYLGQDGFLTVAFAPDGKTVALGGGERIDLREADTGAAVYPGHSRAVKAAVLSPDGQTLATYSQDGLHVWETATGKQRWQMAASAAGIHGFAFTPDSKAIAVLAGDVVLICAAATGKETRRFSVADKAPPDPTMPAFRLPANGSVSVDARRAAVATIDGIHLWDVAAGKEFRHIAMKAAGKEMLRSVTLSPDGRIVIALHVRRTSADARGASYVTIYLWEVATGKLLRKQETNGPLVFSPDGTTLATVGNGVIQDAYNQPAQDSKVRLWNFTTGKELYRLDAVAPMAFSADGQSLSSAGEKGAIRFWKTATGKAVHKIQGPQVMVTSLAVAADGKLLVSGGADTTALVWKWPGMGNNDQPPNTNLNPQELEALWIELALDNPATAYRAIGALIAVPKQAAPLLQDRLKPAATVDPKHLVQLIADLNSDVFKVRQKATDNLEKLGELAAPALQKVLAANPTLEVQQRAERLLAILRERGCAPETLRVMRACVVLEALNTPQTRKVLETLAGGAAADQGTQEAQATAQRLAQRPPVGP